MTEDEAKSKWCPFARSVPGVPDGKSGWDIVGQVPAHNRLAGSSAVGNCLASACMAWRWGPSENKPADISTIHAHMVATGCGPLDATGATSTVVKHGYCGLAGSPS